MQTLHFDDPISVRKMRFSDLETGIPEGTVTWTSGQATRVDFQDARPPQLFSEHVSEITMQLILLGHHSGEGWRI